MGIFKNLKKENKILKEKLNEQRKILEKIYENCIYYKQINCSVGYVGFNKIKTLTDKALDLIEDGESNEY